MTKEDKPQQKNIEDFLDEAEVISRYSDREAVEDGVLFDVAELAKLAPSIKWNEGPFSYVTANLAYSKGYLRDGDEVRVASFINLFTTMGEHMRKTGPDHFYSKSVEFPDGTTGEVCAAMNETGRFTILLPEDY